MNYSTEPREGEDFLICPHCGYKYNIDTEDYAELVTWWGDDTHNLWCHECDKVFEVKEYVSRWWEVVPPEDKLFRMTSEELGKAAVEAAEKE